MAFPTVEVVWSPATEIARNDPHNRETVNAAFTILQAQEGMQKINYGIKHEDKSTFYAFISWDSLEAHQKLMNNAETYPILNAATEPFFAQRPQMYHVKTKSDPFKAFDAPALEVAYFTLSGGQSMSTLEGLVDELATSVKSGAGVIDSAWGSVIEKDDALTLFIGWTSVQAHYDLLKNAPQMSDLVKSIREIADIEVIHVPTANF